MKIMIVEDDPLILSLIYSILNGIKETTILTAHNGVQAWELFKEEQPRIVISDWNVPDLTGLELCKKIRQLSANSYTYVIIITGKEGKEDVLVAFSAGADDYVTKPFDIEELQARIKTGKRIIQLEDDHKALQKTLINSRNKIRTVFDALPEEILTVDRELKVESLNQAASSTMKGGLACQIETRCCSLVEEGKSDFYRKKADGLAQEGFKTGEKKSTIDQFTGPEGDEIIKERIVLPVKDDFGQVQQIIFVSRDITEEHQRNEEVDQLNRELKKISSELIKKNTKLEKALGNLEQTQTQMLQSEKMASIGQLAAGVAHEINNPTGFVSSNLKTLKDYLVDVNQLIDEYQMLKDSLIKKDQNLLESTIASAIKKIDTLEEDIDIEYILEDLQDLIGDCQEGTERIKKIVEDLKHFAHPGEDKIKETDVNKGIESTLNVVYNELKYKANIIKEYGEVPIIYAYPQQLNQVFMNILVNAAQAIEKSGEIRIATSTVDGKAEVRISDTGCGISQENISKIFDPFFTTKDVGAGTGLGMNIAYNIVNKHNGKIWIESKIGEGTTFIIHLPVGDMMDTKDVESQGSTPSH